MRWRRWLVPALGRALRAGRGAARALRRRRAARRRLRHRGRRPLPGASDLPAGLFDDPGFLPASSHRRPSVSRTTCAIAARSGSMPAPTRATRPCISRPNRRRCERASSRSSSTPAGRRRIPPRSRLLNLLGVVTMGRYAVDPGDRSNIVRAAIDAFTNAINVDPTTSTRSSTSRSSCATSSTRSRPRLPGPRPAGREHRRRRPRRQRVLMELTFLTRWRPSSPCRRCCRSASTGFASGARAADPERAEAGGALTSLAGAARRGRRRHARAAGDRGRTAGARHRALGARAHGRGGVLRHGHVALDAGSGRPRRRHASTGRSRRLGDPRPHRAGAFGHRVDDRPAAPTALPTTDRRGVRGHAAASIGVELPPRVHLLHLCDGYDVLAGIPQRKFFSPAAKKRCSSC